MSPHRKAGLRGAAVMLFVALVTACASGPNIVTNAAPGFNLADYRTFSFLRPLSTDNGNVRTILSNELIESTRGQMELSGLRYVETGGDLLVNFVVSTRETIQTRNTPSTGMSMHHGRGRYGTWSGYSMSVSTTEVIQRTEGTVAVDLIDAQRHELVWEGAASGRVTDQVRNNRAAAVDAAIAEIFKRFP